MTLLELSDLLKQLLFKHDSVCLPGMGCFVIGTTPSQLMNEGKRITPPSKKIVFESSIVNPDSLLADSYSKLKNIPESEALNEILELLRRLKKDLIDNAFVELPDFGVIKYGDGGNFVFEAGRMFNVNACYYGLEPLSLKVKQEDLLAVEMQSEVIEQQPVIEEPVKVVEIAEIVDVKEQKVAEEKVDINPSGYRKIFIIIGVILAVVVLLVAAVVIFKEQLMPLLENLLYSDEELEILKRAGR